MSYNQNKSCVSLNSEQTVTKWTDNSTAQPLDFLVMIYPPLLTYTDWYTTNGNTSLLNYQFCGPLIVLIKFFAQHINREINIQALSSDYLSHVLNFLGKLAKGIMPQMVVFPILPLTSMDGWFGEEYIPIRYIWGIPGDVVMSKTLKMNMATFEFLNCWDRYLYIGVFASLIVLSLISVAKQCSCKAFFEALWHFSSIILSDTMTMKMKDKGITRILVMVWLFANTILLSIFSGQLYEFIINGKIIDGIETRNELYTKENWENSKIHTFDLGTMDAITNGIENNDEVAIHFASRSEVYIPLDVILSKDLQIEILADVLANNSVICLNKLSLYYLLRTNQDRYPWLRESYTEGIDYYISKPEKSSTPYHLLIFKDFFPDHLVIEFNKTVSRLQESGIYEFETRMSVTPKGFGRELDLRYEIPEELRIKPIVLIDIRGVFLLLFYGLALAIVALIIELIHYFIIIVNM